MSAPYSLPWFRSRRRFLIQTAASLATVSAVSKFHAASMAATSNPFAMPTAVSARLAASGFLNALSEEQRSTAQIEFGDKRRQEWHFIPMETRKGLPLREMSDTQRKAALGLVASMLSESGFRRAIDIMAYEAILLELEGPTQAKRRDFQKYYVAVYGSPDDQKQWGVSVEGHHLSLNFTFDGDRIVDSTPQFFGVNPANLLRDFKTPSVLAPSEKTEFRKGNRLLVPEEQAAFDLVNSLTKTQRERAIYDSDCPDDIQWAGEPQPKKAAFVGINVKEFDEKQRLQGKAIVDHFFSSVPSDVGSERWQLMKDAGLDKIYFGWAGETEAGKQHFFRLQGPTFIAELCNFQTDPQGTVANHIHSIWRDMTGDFNLPLAS